MKDKPDPELVNVDDNVDRMMTVKALAPSVSLEENLYAHSNGTENGDEEDFDFHLEEEDAAKTDPAAAETEEDILGKFESDADNNATPQNSTTEEKLLEDTDDFTNGHDDVEDEEEEIQAEKDRQDAEILKDQIMDTEDLLQILENKPDEIEDEESSDGDKPAENDIEFDSGNSVLKDATETEEDLQINESSNDKEDELVIDEKSVEAEEKEDDKEEEREIAEKVDEVDKPEEIREKEEVEAETEEKDELDETMVIDEEVEAEEKKAQEKEGEIPTELVTASPNKVASETEDEPVIESPKVDAQTKPPKRTLTDSEPEPKPKRPKLTKQNQPILSLDLFGEFMRKKRLTKLTRADLEQFCLQKMCEALFHKSEIGELRHQLGVQEQMVEMWRKEVVQLSKQARDLEIVNKKLLHGLKLKGEREKPLIPVKITRSVGLQVRSDGAKAMVTPPKRKVLPKPIQQATAVKTQASVKVTPPLIKPAPVAISAKPQNKIINPKANALLSQALTNSTGSSLLKSSNKPITTSAPVRVAPAKQTPVAKTNNLLPTKSPAVSNSTKPDRTFIDLTDEEDKRPQTGAPVVSAAAGVRFVKGANVVTTSSVAANSPRIMYVYNNQLHQGVLAADPSKPGSQKLMLKLNPNVMGQTNGVLATVPGTPLSMSGAPLRPGQPVRLAAPVQPPARQPLAPKPPLIARHPAPLPLPSPSIGVGGRSKPIPPRPHLTIRRSSGGIVLSWKMPYNLDNYESIASYQLYAYQETSAIPSSDMWRKVGDVKALALPMACTLTQFADGNKYHFAVRAVDVHKRMGQFSEPEQILL